MTRFIPKDKLSKKARRQLDAKKRLLWPKSPASRSFASKKTYDRKRKSPEVQDDWKPGDFFVRFSLFGGRL